jgi:hypothetical protein
MEEDIEALKEKHELQLINRSLYFWSALLSERDFWSRQDRCCLLTSTQLMIKRSLRVGAAEIKLSSIWAMLLLTSEIQTQMLLCSPVGSWMTRRIILDCSRQLSVGANAIKSVPTIST